MLSIRKTQPAALTPRQYAELRVRLAAANRPDQWARRVKREDASIGSLFSVYRRDDQGRERSVGHVYEPSDGSPLQVDAEFTLAPRDARWSTPIAALVYCIDAVPPHIPPDSWQPGATQP